MGLMPFKNEPLTDFSVEENREKMRAAVWLVGDEDVLINEYFSGGTGSAFGGYKQCGFGREKGLVALDNYTQIKNVVGKVRT
jgi:acyl-CoA reductase-like NAD-dependent aldehyde dehydrogenase